MKLLSLCLTLLFSSITPLSLSAAICPCVNRENSDTPCNCNCSLRGGECRCAEFYAKEGTVPAECCCAKTDCCSANVNQAPLIEVSYGELFDKVTILEIKEREIRDEQKRAHVITELEILNRLMDAVFAKNDAKKQDLMTLKKQLGDVNWRLWQIEDAIRAKETAKLFDAEFITLARSVYIVNRMRAEIKAKISALLDSKIVEVKSAGWLNYAA